ncbi:MAG TPA: hypothetical protein ENK25_11315 [Bacteroidetes bacterium]|nr:hypothetical protein [Bacteroidota bacterium]
MKKIQAILLITMVALMFTSGSCKKKTCGCDSDVFFDLTEVPGTIYYEDTKFTYFIADDLYGSYFTVCDPEKAWDRVSEFKSGQYVVVSGKAADDCMKQMSYYYSNQYVLHLEDIKRPEF